MALVSIGPQSPSGQFVADNGEIFGKQTAYCYLKTRWNNEDWTIERNLIPLRAEQASLPNISHARLLWRYGAIKDYWTNAFSTFNQEEHRYLYVAIQVVNDDSDPYAVWAGVIPAEELTIHGSDASTPKGDQVVTAYGLEYLLDRRMMHEAVLTDGTRMPWTPAFNRRQPQGFQLLGNRSSLPLTPPPDPPIHRFGLGLDDPVPENRTPKTWTTRQILEYLLHYTNGDPGGDDPYFRLAGPQTLLEFLDVLVDVVEQDGGTVWALLKRLIDRRRGIGATLKWGLDDEKLPGGDVELSLFSLVDSDVAVRDRTLPKNADTFTKRLDDEHGMPEAVVRLDETDRYTQIVVQGARAISCFSISQAALLMDTHAAMEPGWSAADKTAYDACEDDIERKRERFDRVYQVFRLPQDFDFKTQAGRTLNPAFDANGLPDFDTHAPTLNLGHKFLNWLPVLGPAEASFEDETVEPRYLRPMMLVNVLDAGGDPTDLWIRIDEPPPDVDGLQGDMPRASVVMMDRDLTLKLSPTINHVLGRNAFPEDAVTQIAPAYDHELLAGTVAIEADTRPKVIVDVQTPGLWPARTLLIEVDDVQTWLVAPGTIIGVKADGSWDTYNSPWAVDGEDTLVGCIRSDAARLREVAALAAAWYGRTRVAVEYALSGLWAGIRVGQFLESVWTGSNSQEVNSPVTALEWDFERTTTTTRTGFIELDVVSKEGRT